MNADLKAMMDVDLTTAFADQADTATIQTQANVPVVATSTYENQTVDDVGQFPESDLSLVVRTAALTVTPAVNGTVAFNSVTYRIRGIERHPDANALTLMLQRLTQ
jgi:hypothetical protein